MDGKAKERKLMGKSQGQAGEMSEFHPGVGKKKRYKGTKSSYGQRPMN
jgi:hypothetical protein